MDMLAPVFIGISIFFPFSVSPKAASNPAVLGEMLQDHLHPRTQSQAALLLVQGGSTEATEVVRQGLQQTENVEVFCALCSALRLCRDTRFVDELLAAVQASKPAVRDAAGATLALLADHEVILKLQSVIEDDKQDLPVRQAAIAALGRTGRKSAAQVLLDQLSSDNDVIRQSAADALTNLTGHDAGTDIARWRAWWSTHASVSEQSWLEERLYFQSTKTLRLDGELKRCRNQLQKLHQQLYARLPVGDRIGHVQLLAQDDDPSVRTMAVTWATELYTGADGVGQRGLADILLLLSKDSVLEVQKQSVLALGKVTDGRAYDRLRILLKKGRTPVRVAAARSLTQQALRAWERQNAKPPEGTATKPIPVSPVTRSMVVYCLQRALDDPALEVVVEAAENLGALGVAEAGPILSALLRHPSEPVRRTASQALERTADASVLQGLLKALEDSSETVRFNLVGAIGHACGDGLNLPAAERDEVLTCLENLMVKDSDPGVRSRAATVLGACGTTTILPCLWKRVQPTEDARVQEKAWEAMITVIARQGQIDLVYEWDHTLTAAKEGQRRVLMLTELCESWKLNETKKSLVRSATELLIQAHLDLGKWSMAVPLIREQLNLSASDAELEKRLRWLATAAEQAQKDGNHAEAINLVRMAGPFLARCKPLAPLFEAIEVQSKAASDHTTNKPN